MAMVCARLKRIESKTDRERKNRGGDKTEMMVEIACWCEKEALLDNICTDSSPFVCGAFAPFKWSISSSQGEGLFLPLGPSNFSAAQRSKTWLDGRLAVS